MLLFPYPKVNQLLPKSEEPLGTDAHTQVQVLGLASTDSLQQGLCTRFKNICI
ncbi:hypothetical protein [Nostoc sp. JL31]|uniref:hypothetical protein n=1 Tax=Nostoc sp. JL31 TaxID=2815395 RepID=UPI0025FC002B|nr:hypothetical protein [Nostoc sp. JL31]